jgi:hypothetical protein
VKQFNDLAKEHFIVILLGLFMAAGIGFSYGIGNQHTYLVDGLRLINPELLKFDWFATKTTHYHGTFGWVLWIIEKIMPLPVGTVLLNILLIMMSIGALYSIIKKYHTGHTLFSLFLLISMMILTQTTSVGGSYIYSSYLQPSSLSAVFLILAMASFLKAQYLASGFLLAASGLFHTNFLLLGLISFGLAHLLMGRQDFFKRCTANMLPAFIYLLYLLPTLLDMSTSEYGEQARYIYQHIRSPHHYIPMTYLPDFVQYLGINLLALSFILSDHDQKNCFKPLYLLFFVLFTLVMLATLLTSIIFIPFISQLFVWRLAPFSNLLAEVIVSIHIFRLLNGKNPVSRQTLALFSAGLVVLLTYYLNSGGLSYIVALFVSFAISSIFFIASTKCNKWGHKEDLIKTIGVTGIFVLAIVLRYPGSYNHSNLINGKSDSNKQTLFEWVKINTPLDAQIMIPPGMQDFRLNSQRAVVVDWKSPPIMPDEVMEWYQRISDITGTPNINSPKQAKLKYTLMDKRRLSAIKTKYSIDYAVFYSNKKHIKELGDVIFNNAKYTVIEVTRSD